MKIITLLHHPDVYVQFVALKFNHMVRKLYLHSIICLKLHHMISLATLRHNSGATSVGILALVFFLGVSGFLSSCNDKFDDIEKYQRPDWLVGKIYTQIAANPDLSLFAQCMEETGFDTLVDKTGTYTAFAPTNEAFEVYLIANNFGSVEGIPIEEKERLVRSHILQMPWNPEQLQELSSKGWINLNDLSNNKPFGFKRQTLLKNENRSYPVKIERDGELIFETIVPEDKADGKRTVYSNSRKYAPLYFDGFLSAAQLGGDDYSFYYDRSYEQGNLYFAGGKVVGDEIYADNGFIYMIDKVIDPLLNAEELMEAGNGSDSYSDFLNLVHLNSDFVANEPATMEQEGADEGMEVEQLYDLEYPELGFDIHQEWTYNPNSSNAPILTIEYHHGIVVPTNAAFSVYVNSELTGPGKWPNLDAMPANIKKLLVNSHMSDLPIYLRDVNGGFFNANGDFVTIDQSTIIQKRFGSNATFLGVNEVIAPKAFSSVSAPLYLNPDFQIYLAALELSGLLPALKQEDISYSLFIIGDQTFYIDNSLEVRWRDWKKERYTLSGMDLSLDVPRFVDRPRSEITNYMYGQIAIEPLFGAARLEFLETLDGRHIVVNNHEQTITGGEVSNFGYNGDSAIVVNVEEIVGDFYNGEVYEIDGWLRFPILTMHSYLGGTKFLALLQKANMADKYQMKFANTTDKHTLFLPSDDALDAFQADTLSGEALKAFLQFHFIRNEMIFTDGRKPDGLYHTLRRKEQGSSDSYFQLNLSPGIDEIGILKGNGELYYRIEETPGVSNIICTRQNDTPSNEVTYQTEAVVHNIDTVLVADW